MFFSSEVLTAVMRGASPWLYAIAEMSFVILHVDIIKHQFSECVTPPQGAAESLKRNTADEIPVNIWIANRPESKDLFFFIKKVSRFWKKRV